MQLRVYGFPPRGRAGAIALAVAALVVGGVFLTLGLALLAALAVAAVGVGTAIALVRRLTGPRPAPRGRALDPTLEVFAEPPRSPLPPGESPSR
jgi:hypothetical protein